MPVRWTTLAMLVLATIMMPCANAGVFGYDGQLQLSSDYDDNINLAAQSPVSSWNRVTAMMANLSYRSDVFSWRFSPRLQAVRYDESSMPNRNDVTASTQWGVATERSTSTVSVEGVQDTTLTSEPGLTGLTQVNKRHRNMATTIGTMLRWSELTSLGVQAGVTASHYDDARSAGLIDYNYYTATTNVQKTFSERTLITMTASAGQLRVSQLRGSDKLTINSSIGIQYQLNSNASLMISAGPSLVRNNAITGSNEDRGYIYSARYAWQRELGNLTMTLSRIVTPTGYGVLSRQDQVEWNWYQPINERLYGSLTLNGIRNHYVLPAGGLDLNTVDYGVVTTSLGWHLTSAVDMRLSAGYARQRITAQPLPAQRRHMALSLVWSGLSHTMN